MSSITTTNQELKNAQDELFLATLMQEQTITQERLDGGTKKHNYLKVHRSNLGLCIRELIKVYEDRIALSANTAPISGDLNNYSPYYDDSHHKFDKKQIELNAKRMAQLTGSTLSSDL